MTNIKRIGVKYKMLAVLCCIQLSAWAQSVRQHISFDKNWSFAFGHPSDTKKDFDTGTGYFSYYAKAGYGDGAADPKFDDRAWRKLDLPHDWAVEQPFSRKGSFSHGFKAIGRNFPDASVGWYRKSFNIPATDLGKRIQIAFDGVFRNSIVWVNGHYLGNELSGYNGFDYDLSEYLNYGGNNVIAVRVDATMEEGWFYEGAGIYRHVWLNKTDELHVGTNGTFVTTQVKGTDAQVKAAVTVINDSKSVKSFSIRQTIINPQGQALSPVTIDKVSLNPFENKDFTSALVVENVQLWSIETPTLYHLHTEILENGKLVDQYDTRFGIRTIRFDNNEGFFLNGKHVKIKGTNNHQDHAGVGSAMPDALQIFRIKALKALGSNAYRCSHNPPTPELLNACDSLGMVVIDENRLMGITDTHFGNLRYLITRDRNHPSVISWSIGNEEWRIENTIIGARIATQMQAYAKSIDSTRATTAAFSGGWGQGLSGVMDLVGLNYIAQEDPDAQHKKFPSQKIWGTEEGSTFATRGVYFTNDSLHMMAAYDKKPRANAYSIEEGWNYYAKRPFAAGMFIWTGFDYRGEPTPYGWPSIGSYFGMLDQCGFEKDDAWYLKSWWGNQPVLHLLPHWNWEGKEGQQIDVWAYSNCDEVELFLNGKSQGKKAMPVNGHLEWKVAYAPGKLEAIGYKAGKKTLTDLVQTTGEPQAIALSSNKPVIAADGKDLAMVTISVKDKKGLAVPTASNHIEFTITGPGKIIGVGNGDPTSLEPDKYIETIKTIEITGLREKAVEDVNNRPETALNYDDSKWNAAFKAERNADFGKRVQALVYRGQFNLGSFNDQDQLTLFFKSIGKNQFVYINGQSLAINLSDTSDKGEFKLDKKLLKQGTNEIAIVCKPLIKPNDWTEVNKSPGQIQILSPADTWNRNLFNGLAQVIVQSTGAEGEIKLTATSQGVKLGTLSIRTTDDLKK